MENLDSVWHVFIFSLLAGALIGALGYRFFNPVSKQLDKMKSEKDSINEELETYKMGVGEHFDKTSQLVNDLTQNYVKVYQHLAEGAQTLGAGKSFNNLLEQNQGKVSLAVEDKSSVAEVIPDEVIIDAEVEEPITTEETVVAEAPVDFAKPVKDEATASSPEGSATDVSDEDDKTRPESKATAEVESKPVSEPASELGPESEKSTDGNKTETPETTAEKPRKS